MTGKKLIAICILIGAFLRLSGQGAYLPPTSRR